MFGLGFLWRSLLQVSMIDSWHGRRLSQAENRLGFSIFSSIFFTSTVLQIRSLKNYNIYGNLLILKYILSLQKIVWINTNLKLCPFLLKLKFVFIIKHSKFRKFLFNVHPFMQTESIEITQLLPANWRIPSYKHDFAIKLRFLLSKY